MKTALITGANKGIGYEVARQLAGKGFQVFVGARNRDAGRKAADEIARKGGQAIFLEIDVADNASVTAAASEFAKAADHLDVLVNNAGIIVDGDNAILEISDELLRKTLETNTLGALRVTRACMPLLKESKAPRVINVSSGGGQLTGGAVNSVCPGWVRTDMGGQGATRSVEEGADTIVWLAVDAPQNVTGKFFRDRKEIPW